MMRFEIGTQNVQIFLTSAANQKKLQRVFILNKGADFQNQIIGNNSTKRGCFIEKENVDGWFNPALRQIFNLPGKGFCSFLGRSG